MNEYRAAIQDMKRDDAIEYLLLVIDRLTDPSRSFAGAQLPGQLRVIFDALWLRKGEVVSRDHLYDILFGSRSADSLPFPKTIDVQMYYLRQRLKGTDWEIETVRGHGWRLYSKKKVTPTPAEQARLNMAARG